MRFPPKLRQPPLTAHLLSALLALACQSDPGPTAAATSQPQEAPRVQAGQWITFPCTGEVLLTPLGGWSGSGATQRAFHAGDYLWRCLDTAIQGRVSVAPGPWSHTTWQHLPQVLRLGSTVHFSAHRADRWGNLDPQALPLLFTPHDAVAISHQGSHLIRPGRITVQARLTHDGLSPPASFTVDSGPPHITITDPPRGAILPWWPNQPILVSGTVTDDGPTPQLLINGIAVHVNADSTWQHPLWPSHHGMVHIHVQAVDAAGYLAHATRTVLFGPLRQPHLGHQQALRLHLPHHLLDNDTPAIDDVARALEILANVITIPDQRIDFGCEGKVRLTHISARTERIDIKPEQDKISLALHLGHLSLRVSADVCACLFGWQSACISTSATVQCPRAALWVDIAASPSPTPSLRVTRTHIDMAPLQINWRFWDGRMDWAIALFESQIRATVIHEVETRLARLLSQQLNLILSRALPNYRLQVPPPFAEEILLDTHLHAIHLEPHGMSLDLQAKLLHSPSDHSEHLHHLQLSSTSAPALPADAVGIAIALDVINDAIFSLFARGALHDLSLQLQELGLESLPALRSPIGVHAHLPPFITTGQASAAIALVIPDLELHLRTALADLALSMSVMVPVHLGFERASYRLRLTLLTDDLHLQLSPASILEAQHLAPTLADLENIAKMSITALLRDFSLAIPLPILDLGRVPGLDNALRMVLHDVQFSVTPGAYLTAVGQVRVALP